MLDTDLTRHLANLSKLAFTEEELLKMTDDMSDIIALTDVVNDFNEDAPPHKLNAVDYNDLRNDIFEKSNGADEITRGSKHIKNNSFVVPKVV